MLSCYYQGFWEGAGRVLSEFIIQLGNEAMHFSSGDLIRFENCVCPRRKFPRPPPTANGMDPPPPPSYFNIKLSDTERRTVY
jgi:hypothetical protein